MYKEPEITVNGIQLSESQCMTIRVAVTNFNTHLDDEDYLGDDSHGKQLTKVYKERLNEIEHIMNRNRHATPGIR